MNPYHNRHILIWLQITRHDSLGNLYCLLSSEHRHPLVHCLAISPVLFYFLTASLFSATVVIVVAVLVAMLLVLLILAVIFRKRLPIYRRNAKETITPILADEE